MACNIKGGGRDVKVGEEFQYTDSTGKQHTKIVKEINGNMYTFTDGTTYTKPEKTTLPFFTWNPMEKKGGKRRKTKKSKRSSRRKTHRRR